MMISHLSAVDAGSACAFSSNVQEVLQPAVSILGARVLLQKYDEDGLRQVITQEVPSLAIRSIKVLSNGWNNIVADVNDEWIFRFPRNEDSLQEVEQEHLLLDKIRQSILFPIPKYEFVGKSTAFVGYRKIKGEPLLRDVYASYSDQERQKIAESFAQFFQQLHTGVRVDDVFCLGVKKVSLRLYWIEESITGTIPEQLSEMILEALSYLKKYSAESHEDVVVHNDLHGENLAIDPEKKEINGVFDFSDAVIGNYAIDFRRLFDIHEDLVARVSAVYARIRNVPNPLFAAAAYQLWSQALSIMNSRDVKDMSEEWESTVIEELQKFLPIWNELKASQSFFNAAAERDLAFF